MYNIYIIYIKIASNSNQVIPTSFDRGIIGTNDISRTEVNYIEYATIEALKLIYDIATSGSKEYDNKLYYNSEAKMNMFCITLSDRFQLTTYSRCIIIIIIYILYFIYYK